ncbi:MORC family CW-type zinc finger protein 3 [Glycine soja]|nr:MORC family CW-type zinc finger protein 3 [Glycine soja]
MTCSRRFRNGRYKTTAQKGGEWTLHMEICGEAIQGTKMSSIEIVDLCNSDDDEVENVGSEPAKKLIEIKKETCQVTENIIQVASEGNRSSSALSTCHSYSTRQMEEMVAPLYVDVDDTTGLSLPPFCRNFWRAGYHHDNNGLSSKLNFPNTGNYLHVHPFFLHSNATSHKWVFGAIAELIDNAVDEVILFDDGGGMDPEAMRQCMSFGFSNKSKIAIGQYGNGFKTGSMRLGADVIVFSRHQNNMKLTQSIGLLSYTYLMQTQQDRVVVPMFDDIGNHGTKIIIFNLWFNDDGNLELDFNSDPEDIHIVGDIKKIDTHSASKIVNEGHIANRFHYSLHAYLSILYLRIPESFRMILRGQVVKLHNIADDLKYTEFVLYRPQCGSSKEGVSVTTIGFVKEAPKGNIHGFNVYHKNRLILPFWKVVNYTNTRGRGVVGILQADYLEPTHNKQDFERTSLFQKLELRLKQMTWEYWDYHCHLIGYCKRSTGDPGAPLNKRKTHGSIDLHKMKRQAMQENVTVAGCDQNVLTTASPTDQTVDQRIINLMEVQKKLLKECLKYEKAEEELNLKVTQLRRKTQEAKHEYDTLMAEVKSLGLYLWEENGSVAVPLVF